MDNHNVTKFPLAPNNLTLEDFLISEEGEAAALQGREQNPYCPNTSKARAWEFGYKVGMRRPLAIWHGILEPYKDNPYSFDEYQEDLATWFKQGQDIAIAIGEKKLTRILSRDKDK